MMSKNTYITIGKLSDISGFSTDTIRYYEKMGVLGKPERAANGYRVYTQETLSILLFIKRAKVINFTLEEIKMLLTMAESNDAVCGEVLAMVEGKITAFQTELADTQLALDALQRFAHDCPGGQVPTDQCPFIDYLQHKEKP